MSMWLGMAAPAVRPNAEMKFTVRVGGPMGNHIYITGFLSLALRRLWHVVSHRSSHAHGEFHLRVGLPDTKEQLLSYALGGIIKATGQEVKLAT
jgi:hypothetical protein